MLSHLLSHLLSLSFPYSLLGSLAAGVFGTLRVVTEFTRFAKQTQTSAIPSVIPSDGEVSAAVLYNALFMRLPYIIHALKVIA